MKLIGNEKEWWDSHYGVASKLNWISILSRISDWLFHSGSYFSIWQGPLRWMPTSHCLNLLTAVGPVELVHCWPRQTSKETWKSRIALCHRNPPVIGGSFDKGIGLEKVCQVHEVCMVYKKHNRKCFIGTTCLLPGPNTMNFCYNTANFHQFSPNRRPIAWHCDRNTVFFLEHDLCHCFALNNIDDAPDCILIRRQYVFFTYSLTLLIYKHYLTVQRKEKNKDINAPVQYTRLSLPIKGLIASSANPLPRPIGHVCSGALRGVIRLNVRQH